MTKTPKKMLMRIKFKRLVIFLSFRMGWDARYDPDGKVYLWVRRRI